MLVFSYENKEAHFISKHKWKDGEPAAALVILTMGAEAVLLAPETKDFNFASVPAGTVLLMPIED